MRQKLSSILLITAFLVLSSPIWATSLSVDDLKSVVAGITDDQARQLATTGQVTRFFESDGKPRLIPSSSLTPEVRSNFEENAHTVGVEALFVMKPGPGNRGDRMLRWYNTLRSISTMKGIQYYSVTHGRRRVLFRDSYVVNNSRELKRLPDPLVNVIPAESTLTIKQDDSTFGEAIFHLDYRNGGDALSMSMVNLNTLSLWFIPVIGQKQMVLQLVLLPYKDSLLFYGGVEVKTISFFGIQNATRDSFVNRIEALQMWFKDVATHTILTSD